MEDDALDFCSKKLNKTIENINDIHKEIYLEELNYFKNSDVKIPIIKNRFVFFTNRIMKKVIIKLEMLIRREVS